MLILVILFFFTCNSCNRQLMADTKTSSLQAKKQLQYLALGDSYTIGESVNASENFPNLFVSMMRKEGLGVQDARIIAKTGWTTDELSSNIKAAGSQEPLQENYDLVSLLIGVNNQYRGRTAEEYNSEFEALLQKAIAFAGNRVERVVVLSIPDWGVTPFATGRDREKIAREIDAFNTVNKRLALQYKVHYIDITPWTREAPTDPSLLAADGLHPSGKEYKRWAEKIAAFFRTKV